MSTLEEQHVRFIFIYFLEVKKEVKKEYIFQEDIVNQDGRPGRSPRNR